MKLIKTFLLIVLVLSFVLFLMQNNAKVYVDLIFISFNNASVAMVIFGSLATGILLGYLFAIFSILSAKAELRSMQNKNKRIADELNDLRNVAIDEGIYENDGGEH
ncbi:MAG: lipopolysaccharide assembly LapA domain-containing protein [Candidatus Neomarinimicrobiota bacterium]